MAKKDITILKTETANKILSKKSSSGAGSGTALGSNQLNTLKSDNPLYGQPQLIKIVEEADEKGGYYKVIPVVRDASESDATKHIWIDPGGNVDMWGLEISGAEGLVEDEKKAYIATLIVDSNDRFIWAFSVGGAPSPRSWVIINTVNSPSNYIGDVIDKVTKEVLETAVEIIVEGATANAFEAGYETYADSYTDTAGTTTYFIDGYQLG